MSVVKALRKSSHLQEHIRPGKQALHKAARSAVVESRGVNVVDSLDLDSATHTEFPADSRWDYLVGTTARGASVVAVEVHPATAKEVQALIAKKSAASALLKGHLTTKAQVKRWFWVASGRSTLPQTTAAFRALNKAGIEFVGNRLDLDERL